MWKLFTKPLSTPNFEAEINSLRRDNQRLRDQVDKGVEAHKILADALHEEKLFASNLLAAKDALIESLRSQLTATEARADAHMGRVEKILDYMTLTSTGKTIFAPEPAKPAEEAEVPEEQVKSVVDRLMNQPVEDNIMVQAVKAVGRRPRAIQKFVQKHRDDEAKQRVADQFEADRTDVTAAVEAELKTEAVA